MTGSRRQSTSTWRFAARLGSSSRASSACCATRSRFLSGAASSGSRSTRRSRWRYFPDGSESLHYRRLAAVRLFAEYLRGVDASVEVPGVEILRNGPPRRRPFLYTDEEILALMRAAESLKTPHRRATYQTLIGLLASTGMRVGEAIGIDLDDFDPVSESSWCAASSQRSASCRSRRVRAGVERVPEPA